jgi:hypothetical protein
MNPASTPLYRQNRAAFSLDELRKRNGQWVAFSADAKQIVAAAATLSELADRVRALQQDLRDVVLERIELESAEINLGAAEWF